MENENQVSEDLRVSANVTINIAEARFTSSRRNYLGTVLNNSNGPYTAILKPYSADAGEQIMTWYRITIVNTSSSSRTFTPTNFKMVLSSLISSTLPANSGMYTSISPTRLNLIRSGINN